MIPTNPVEQPEGDIDDVQDSYKYLGIPRAYGNHEQSARKSATVKYVHRGKRVLRIQLNGQIKIQATYTYALPIVRCPASINLSKGRDESHKYQNKEAPHHAARVLPQVQNPETVH